MYILWHIVCPLFGTRLSSSNITSSMQALDIVFNSLSIKTTQSHTRDIAHSLVKFPCVASNYFLPAGAQEPCHQQGPCHPSKTTSLPGGKLTPTFSHSCKLLVQIKRKLHIPVDCRYTTYTRDCQQYQQPVPDCQCYTDHHYWLDHT